LSAFFLSHWKKAPQFVALNNLQYQNLNLSENTFKPCQLKKKLPNLKREITSGGFTKIDEFYNRQLK